MKAFFGDATDLESLRAQLASLRDGQQARSDRAAELMTHWLAGRLQFPARIHYTALAADLIDRLHLAVYDWATDWLDRTEAWEQTGLHEVSDQQARAVIQDRLAKHTDGGPRPRSR